ncbi:hypothetical protein L6R52_39445 [Myxococcota bacterium]|nr:hypothetical protein [Myxococcota bacterium]
MALRHLKLAFPLALASLVGCSSGGTDTPDPEVCTNVSGTVSADGLDIRKPEEDAKGCTVVPNPSAVTPENVCMEKEPDFSCVRQADPLGTPALVTFTGCVASFGLAAQSDDLTVTVLREVPVGASVATDPGYDLMGDPGAQLENTPNAFVGQTISERVATEECQDEGKFSVVGVPTETPLIVRVTDQHYPSNEREYIDTYQYNVILRNAVVRSGPTLADAIVADTSACTPATCFVVDEVNTIGVATFRTVSLAAGVSDVRGDDDLYDGSGQGHLAGEVQDCTSEDTVQNAVVGLDVAYRKLAYFNVGFMDRDNIDDAKVEGTRSRTNADGLYAAIAVDVQAGGQAVKVGAAITASVCGADGVCKCVDGATNPAYTAADSGEGDSTVLATRTVYVFPDSITILTFDRQAYVSR